MSYSQHTPPTNAHKGEKLHCFPEGILLLDLYYLVFGSSTKETRGNQNQWTPQELITW
jgi:hypothetical protein